MEQLVELLPQSGSMAFADFMSAVRTNGLRGELWLRAKHRGLLHTFIDAQGVVRIARGAATAEAQ